MIVRFILLMALTVSCATHKYVSGQCYVSKNGDYYLTIDEKLDNGRYIFLELHYEIFIDIVPLLRQLDDLGIIAIISHPERQRVLAAQPEIVSKWSDFGVGVHITSGSILGLFGSAIQKAAWNFLNADCNCVVATDAHDTSCRGPVMTAAFELITQKLGKDAARKLCIENPSRIIEGKDICK